MVHVMRLAALIGDGVRRLAAFVIEDVGKQD